MGAIVIPNLRYLMPHYKRNEFISRIAALVQFGWQDALITQKVHRLFFDLNKGTIRLEIETKKSEQGKEFFEPATRENAPVMYQWPENIEIKQFYIEGKNMMGLAGIKTETIWFYFVPEGLVQDVIINVTDTKELDAAGKPKNFSLTINPFSAQVKTHEGFEKP